ncbi:hypothetical protein EHZ86_16675, partial [Aeromonas australiensis]|uniref:hypothetical protein n=1 Tax=Aeromonas australiensis TaxID=1114880 RepID=UPI001F40767B
MITETYNLVTVWIYSISAVVALLMLGVAIFQLTRLTSQVNQAVKSNAISQLNALLALEGQIVERRKNLGEVGIELAELSGNDDVSESKITALKLRFDEAKQMYLNALDRLCFCVKKDLLNSDDMRLEYRDIINRAV